MARNWYLACALLCGCLLWAGRAPAGASCREEAGQARAETYVQECLAITTATRPPCNAENACAVIGEHIQYMCAHDPNPPAWCQAYKDDPVPDPPPSMAVKAGFDCAKASSPVERAICASPPLAADDREMAERYRRLSGQAADKEALRAGQREFIAERAHCADPEAARPPGGAVSGHCIAELTHLRITELKRLAAKTADAAWTASASPCEASFGDDGWDQIDVQPAAGRTAFDWTDLREAVLMPSDQVAFEVDGADYPAKIDVDADGQANAVATDAGLVAAMGRGQWLRVKRNGKVIFRAALAGFSAACAKAPGR